MKVETRARFYILLIFVFLVISALLNLKKEYTLKNLVDNDFDEAGRLEYGLLLSTVPLVLLAFLIHAFVIMRGYNDKF